MLSSSASMVISNGVMMSTAVSVTFENEASASDPGATPSLRSWLTRPLVAILSSSMTALRMRTTRASLSITDWSSDMSMNRSACPVDSSPPSPRPVVSIALLSISS